MLLEAMETSLATPSTPQAIDVTKNGENFYMLLLADFIMCDIIAKIVHISEF